MAGLFFSRKSKNGVGTSTEPEAVAPDSQVLYEPIPAASMLDEPPNTKRAPDQATSCAQAM